MHQCLLQTYRFTQVLALFIFASITCQEFYTYFPKFLRLCSLGSVESYFSRKSGTMCQFFDKHGYPVPIAPKLTLITKSYTLVRQEDDQVTNFKNTFAMQKETTRTHPVIRHLNLPNHILSNIQQFAAFPYIWTVQKAAKLQEKNLSFKYALLITTVSTSPFHSTIYSCFLIIIFPLIAQLHFLHIKTCTSHNCYKKHSKCHLLNSLWWPIYIINSVDNTELPCFTLPQTQYHNFFRNFPPLFYFLRVYSETLLHSKPGLLPLFKFVLVTSITRYIKYKFPPIK